MANDKPNGRVTHQDLLALMRDVRAWCDNQGERLDSLRAHLDDGLAQVRDSLDNLEHTTNNRLHEFEGRLDAVERADARRIRWADLKIALLRGSWKLTATMITGAGFISGLIVRYGAPWEWHWGR
jgi:hypothetical protein